jgi:hypothetical protein
MDDQTGLVGRVPLGGACADIENFLEAAQHLKALKLQLAELQLRRSRREHALGRQIECATNLCEAAAKRSHKVRELWKATQQDLARITVAIQECEAAREATRAEPCHGGSDPP